MAVNHHMMNVHSLNPPSNLIESSQRACAQAGFDPDWTKDEGESDSKSYWTTYERRAISLMFSLGAEPQSNGRILNIGFQDHLYPSNWDEPERHQEFFDSCIELICRLADVCVADYMGLFTSPRYDEIIPSNLPLAEHIDKVPPIGVYSESLLQNFGGLSGLFKEPCWEYPQPPWRVGELDNGSLLVITHPKPWTDSGWTESSYIDLRSGEEYF